MQDRYLNLTAGRLIMKGWKAEETAQDIKEGKLSYSKNMPILVSYCPEEKKYLIMDGHHRAMELFNAGQSVFCCQISEHQPKTYNIYGNTITLKKFYLPLKTPIYENK